MTAACPDVDALSEMMERTLEPGRVAELELHLDSCAHCRKLLTALAAGSPVHSGPRRPFAELDASLPHGTKIADRYVVRAELGRGGMGAVYLVHDESLDRDVALKLHHAGAGNERLRREALAMARLAHPNVAGVFEVAMEGEQIYIAMEYIAGGTLRTWLAVAPRSWRKVAAMLLGAGRGLAAAHRAGLIHRDFKPENVLVGDDGRARVADFGLARDDDPLPVADAALAGERTAGNAGTPAYMAPEQLAGRTIDARSDQFAFCVVAWECLYGARPFLGATVAELKRAFERDELAPRRSEVPDRVRRVLARGLARDPSQRFPDLAALLASFERAAAPRTLRNIVAASVAALALAGGALWLRAATLDHRRDAACRAERDRVHAIFGAPKRVAMERAFTATTAAFASSAVAHVSSVLDRYVTSLADRADFVCRDRDTAPAVHAAQLACLEARETELASLVDALTRADRAVVARAPEAAWATFVPRPCQDVAPGSTTILGAADVAKLGEITARLRAGQYRGALALAQPLIADARARHDPALELAAQLLFGQLQAELAPPAAPAVFRDAAALAESLGRDLDAASALSSLANAEIDGHDYAAAHQQIELARAKLVRIGGNTATESHLALTEGELLMNENRLGEADAATRTALALLESSYGADHPTLGEAYGTLSEILEAEARPDDARAAAEHALAILERSLGDEHPTTAGARMTLAVALLDAKRFDEARDQLMRADTIFREIYGDDHPTRAAIYGNLGLLERDQHHWDAAITAFRTALELVDRHQGGAAIAGAERDLSGALAGAGRLDDALAASQRAVDVLVKLGSEGAPRLAGALDEVCDLQLARHQAKLAVPIAERALALAAQRPADANAGELADARFALARALWDAGGDRARAGSLADQANTHPDPGRRAEIAAWHAAHAR